MLFDSLSKKVTIDSSIQFFYPYRGSRENIMRVVLDSPYLVTFDLTQNGDVFYNNEISNQKFTFFANKFFNGDFQKARDFVFDKIGVYKKNGIDAIVKGKDFIHIQTMYMDSSYATLDSVNKNYSDKYYLKVIKENPSYNGYCITYYLFDKEQDSLPFYTHLNVMMANKRLFYYREAIRGIGYASD
jgi:hypothetical protein